MHDGAGFFGKVRTQGDFVSRRLAVEFVGPWDVCLQRGMLHAQDVFGAQWLPVYLTAPVWNFALGPHVCGASAWAGVMMPGVDRVGRYFPFTIAAALDGVDDGGEWLRHAQDWYDRAAELALSTLADDFQLDAFDARLSAFSLATEPVEWRFDISDDAGAERHGFGEWLGQAFADGASVWWSEGSAHVPASACACAGLIDAPGFARLFDVNAPDAPGLPAPVRLVAR
jgi:type VI secretion system protein ImpM